MTAHLPWDILLYILRLADTDTLAIAGRVSSDFLLATTPLLYRHIEVNTAERLEQLFCERDDTGVSLYRRLRFSTFCPFGRD